MGEQKALLPFGGGTLLEYQLHSLASLEQVTEIVVVTGFRPERLRPLIHFEAKAREAHNASFDGGKVTSILCGLRAVPDDADAILLLAVDQPRPARILRALIESHEAAAVPITVPLNEGHRGHPIIFTAALLPELRSIDEATLGVRAVLERHADEINEVAFGDPIVRLDLNTPDDAERARRMLGPSV